MKRILFMTAILAGILGVTSTAWAQEGKVTVGKCDVTKISKITETTVEYNVAATNGSQVFTNDTLQGGHAGAEVTDTREYALDEQGNISSFLENGRQVDPGVSIPAAFIKGNTECAGMALMSYRMYKSSPESARFKSPEFNLDGKWFIEKPVMGKAHWSRYKEQTRGEKLYLIIETRGLTTNIGQPVANGSISIRYDEIDLSNSLITKMVVVDYTDPAVSSIEQIDIERSIESWGSDHAGKADYFKDVVFVYEFR